MTSTRGFAQAISPIFFVNSTKIKGDFVAEGKSVRRVAQRDRRVACATHAEGVEVEGPDGGGGFTHGWSTVECCKWEHRDSTPHLGPMTRSRPLARPATGLRHWRIPFVASQATQVPVRGGEDDRPDGGASRVHVFLMLGFSQTLPILARGSIHFLFILRNRGHGDGSSAV